MLLFYQGNLIWIFYLIIPLTINSRNYSLCFQNALLIRKQFFCFAYSTRTISVRLGSVLSCTHKIVLCPRLVLSTQLQWFFLLLLLLLLLLFLTIIIKVIYFMSMCVFDMCIVHIKVLLSRIFVYSPVYLFKRCIST